MSKKGKDFKMPTPLFSRAIYENLGAIAINEYRKITFDKSNPKMANKQSFPKYSKGYEKRKATGKINVGGQKRTVHGGYARSVAPVAVGGLLLDTQHSVSPANNAIYIGWTSHAYKVDHLRKMGRILTSRSNPINPDVIKKMMLYTLVGMLKQIRLIG